MSSATPGTYLKLMGAMIFWGGTWIAGRIVAQEVVAPVAAAALRFALAAGALGLFAGLTEGLPPRPRGAEWGTVIGLGVTGIFFYNLCFLYGLKSIAAGRGALVVALNPVVVALAAWFLGAEAMGRLKALGVVLALVGCLAVIGNGSPLALLSGSIGVGELLILGCVLCWTLYTFIGRRATRSMSALGATYYASLVGAALLALTAGFGAPVAFADWSWRVWASILFLGLFGTAVAFTWYAEGVKHLGAARAAAFINFVPVAAVLQAAWLLDERLDPAVLAGGALVLAGVWLTNLKWKENQ